MATQRLQSAIPSPRGLPRVMALHDQSSYAEAIEYVVDTTLVHEVEITVHELIQMLSERVEESE